MKPMLYRLRVRRDELPVVAALDTAVEVIYVVADCMEQLLHAVDRQVKSRPGTLVMSLRLVADDHDNPLAADKLTVTKLNRGEAS